MYPFFNFEYKVILTGGRNEFFVPMGTVDIINESGPCRSTAVMPSTLYDHMATYVNGKIVLCGGHTGATHVRNKIVFNFYL